jgi:predicted transcriptional regulator
MNLEKYLLKRKVNAQTFAFRSGLSKATVHNIITGKRTKIELDSVVRVIETSNHEITLKDLVGKARYKEIMVELKKRSEIF